MKLTDTASERMVLGGIVKHGFDGFVEADDLITTTSFSDKTNQAIYLALKSIYDEDKEAVVEYPILLATLSRLGFSKFFSNNLELEHLKSIYLTPISISNIRRCAATIRKLEIARGLSLKVDEIKQALHRVSGEEPLSSILGLVENPVFDYISSLSNEQIEPKKISTGLSDYVKYLAENQRETFGIPSGFPTYDKAIGGGFRRKTVTVIGARPKTGKTMLVNNIGEYVTSQFEIPVLNLDTEMSIEEQQVRYLAMVSGVSINEIESGKYVDDPVKKSRVEDAIKSLEARSVKDYYHVGIAGQAFEETISLMRRWLFKVVGQTNGKTNDCLIIFDYLKLMDPNGLSEHLQEYQRLGFMMTALHNFAVKYDVPILLFTQLNRDGISKESSDVISGSDRIAFFCSSFSIFKKKDPEEMAEDGPENGNRKIVTLLSRHGEGLDDGNYINLNFQGSIGKITEVSTRNHVHFEEVDDNNLEF